jgi:CDP-diacylglycerol--glycerol-3-phosphate 3-phosphatidyltransferase
MDPPMTTEAPGAERFWNVPNTICLFRLVGVAPLVWTAHAGERKIFFWVLLALLLSDWLDGKLAKLLHQRTVRGARLDSAVDAVMYAAAGLSLWWLEEAVIRKNLPLLLTVLGSWLLSVAVGILRFSKLPSYHMWSAKVSWFWASCALLALLLAGNPVLMPWALGLAVFANLHAVAITVVLPDWKADVWSLRQAWRIRKETEGKAA